MQNDSKLIYFNRYKEQIIEFKNVQTNQDIADENGWSLSKVKRLTCSNAKHNSFFHLLDKIEEHAKVVGFNNIEEFIDHIFVKRKRDFKIEVNIN